MRPCRAGRSEAAAGLGLAAAASLTAGAVLPAFVAPRARPGNSAAPAGGGAAAQTPPRAAPRGLETFAAAAASAACLARFAGRACGRGSAHARRPAPCARLAATPEGAQGAPVAPEEAQAQEALARPEDVVVLPPLPEQTKPFDPAEQVGVTAPLGFFDPLGFCPRGDEATFRSLRSKELKHGRVAMLASFGSVFEHFGRFQFLGFNEQKGIFIDRMLQQPGTWAFQILVIMCAVVELGIWKEDPDREPGDFGDPAGFTNVFPYDEDMRNRELNNGRMAMFTSIGILAAEALTGKDAIQQFGF